MYIIFAVFFLIFLFIFFLYLCFKTKIKFIVTGLDSGFKMPEILLLWKLSVKCVLSDPCALFWSDTAMSQCISKIIEETKNSNSPKVAEMNKFLSKLYDFRTKKIIHSSQKKGIDSSKALVAGQKLILVVSGIGVFASKVINNAHELTIKFPVLKSGNSQKKFDWERLPVIVYFWRKNDANYTFDTVSIGSGTFRGESVLYLRHSNNLLRVQKRKTVRADCHIPASLYLMTKNENSNAEQFSDRAYHCILEDVSESGALIRIGGKGIANIKIKLVFMLNTEEIVMFGMVKSVEFNATLNQSRLHLECPDLDQVIKNKILSFVYNITPQDEIYAIEQLEKQQNEEDNESVNSTEESDETDDNSEDTETSAEESSVETVTSETAEAFTDDNPVEQAGASDLSEAYTKLNEEQHTAENIVSGVLKEAVEEIKNIKSDGDNQQA